ncbi:uncharacterized protein LOC142628802 [Castanea sativa]|uniref:uncharacterized protein LOC142628802 n=1 Tax=Castanea sativa TaxID=21020 RepID=UPI003F64E0B4
MAYNLIIRHSEDIAAIWVLQTDIPLQLICKVMDRLRLLIRITPHRSIGETHFSMTYGAEAVIPLETNFSMLRMSSFSSSNNDGLLERSLDLVEERRESAMVQLAYYQHKLKQGYDSNVKSRLLALGYLVLRKVLGIAKNPAW